MIYELEHDCELLAEIILDEVHGSAVDSILEAEIHSVHSANPNHVRMEATQQEERASETWEAIGQPPAKIRKSMARGKAAPAGRADR